MFEVAWYSHSDRFVYYCRTYKQAQNEAKLRSQEHIEAYIWSPEKRLIEVWRFGEKSNEVL